MFYTYSPATPSTTNVEGTNVEGTNVETTNVERTNVERTNVEEKKAAPSMNEKKNYTAHYDDNTWLQLIKNAVNECVVDNVPVNTLNVEERLKDLFGFKIGRIYTYEVATPDGKTRYAYEACHKLIIRKMLKRLIACGATR